MSEKEGYGKISRKSSGKGKYEAIWVYIPSKLSKNESFPFKDKEKVRIEIKGNELVIKKSDNIFDTISIYGFENMTLSKLIETKAQKNENKTFLYYKEQKFSYYDLNAKANRIAHGILKLMKEYSLRKPTVAVMLENSPDYVFSWLGIAKVRGVNVFLNQYHEPYLLEHVLKNSKAKLLIIDYKYLNILNDIDMDKLLDLKQIIVRNAPKDFKFNKKYKDFKEIYTDDDSNPNITVKPADKMEIVYTSAATAMPKGFLYRHFTMFTGYLLVQELEKIDYNKSDVIYSPLPLYNAFTRLLVFLPALFKNSSIVLAESLNALAFWDDVKKFNITGVIYYGKVLPLLLNQPAKELDRTHTIKWAYGSEASKEVWELFENRFGIPITEMWTLSEGAITINTVGSKGEKIGSIGKPIQGFTVDVIDNQGNILPPGPQNIGEIVFRNLFELRLQLRKGIEVQNNWIHTGDLGYKDHDGFFYYRGRREYQIQKNGNSTSLLNIEKIADRHPFIIESCAFAVPGEDQEEEDIKICIVLKTPGLIDYKEIHDYLNENMAFFSVPRYIEIKERLSITPFLRIKRTSLKREWENTDIKKNTWDSKINKMVL